MQNMSSHITVETIPIMQSGNNDPWKDYAFVSDIFLGDIQARVNTILFSVIRRLGQQENQEPTFKIVIKSEYLLKACKDVIISWPGVSWNSDPLEVGIECLS